MFISATILYFHENPVGYEFYKTESGFELRPAPSTKSNLIPPLITIVQSNGLWKIDGVQDEDICAQVMQLVENHHHLYLTNPLSAAS